MTAFQKIVKYGAIALAVFLIVSIVGGLIGAAGIFGMLTEGEVVAEQMRELSVSQNVTSLDLRINAAALTVRLGDSFHLESNLKNLKVSEQNGTLVLEDSRSFWGNSYGAALVLTVPASTVFDSVRLVSGAGKVTADELSAKALRLELGAGEVTIGCLNAERSAEIEGGAGKITVQSGELSHLELSMGVGQLNLRSAFRGDCELELGVGESNLTFIGSRAEYALEVEKGIGSLRVNGQSVSDFGSSTGGSNRVEIHGGIGAINLAFTEPDA